MGGIVWYPKVYRGRKQTRQIHPHVIAKSSKRNGLSLFLWNVLMELNTDYHTKRQGAVGMLPPKVIDLSPGTFYRWMRGVGKLGDQHKVPRVTNDRTVAEQLVEIGVQDARFSSTAV